MFKLVLEKAEEPEIKLPTSVGLSKKKDSSRKTSIFALLTMSKPLTMSVQSVQLLSHVRLFATRSVDHHKLENSERDGNTRPPDLPLEKFICGSGSNS